MATRTSPKSGPASLKFVGPPIRRYDTFGLNVRLIEARDRQTDGLTDTDIIL